MCWKCDLAEVRAADPGDPVVRRGHDRISEYMRRHNVSFPEAIEALAQERRRQTAEAVAAIAEHHGLDDRDAWLHLLAYAPEIPERMQ
jgi:hypothetical protein